MKMFIPFFLTFICFSATQVKAQPEPTFITIWIHGTKLTPNKRRGMRPLSTYDIKYEKRLIAQMMAQVDPSYSFEDTYMYGWSGKLCFEERYAAARDLYCELLKLRATYQKSYGILPQFRLITFSHGGSVALQLAEVHDVKHQIEIEELILLGCPVQQRTKKLIFADCFVSIYSFYSKGDWLQVLDPQGWYKNGKSKRLFSERLFDYHPKVRQARIKMGGWNLTHVGFMRERFLKQLPRLCRALDNFHTGAVESQKHCVKQLDMRTYNGKVWFRRKII